MLMLQSAMKREMRRPFHQLVMICATDLPTTMLTACGFFPRTKAEDSSTRYATRSGRQNSQDVVVMEMRATSCVNCQTRGIKPAINSIVDNLGGAPSTPALYTLRKTNLLPHNSHLASDWL